MMSVKKNLTVATLVALLAVPVFKSTNSASIYFPKFSNILMTKAHADSFATGSDSLTYKGATGVRVTPTSNGKWTTKYFPNEKVYIPANSSVDVEYYGTKKNVVQPRKIVGQYMVPVGTLNPTMSEMKTVDSAIMRDGGSQQGPDAEVKIDGHDVGRTGAGGFDIDGHEASFNKVMSILNAYTPASHSKASHSNTNENISSTKTSNSIGNNNSVTASHNINSLNNKNNISEADSKTDNNSSHKLPQTGENDTASKAMAMGAVALGTSASLMALSMAKKHRRESELNSILSEPTVDDSDNKSNDNNADDIDTDYHMIMSDTFANISKDLKQI